MVFHDAPRRSLVEPGDNDGTEGGILRATGPQRRPAFARRLLQTGGMARDNFGPALAQQIGKTVTRRPEKIGELLHGHDEAEWRE